MTKKQVMGREFFSAPNQSYKRELLDLEGQSVWVREVPVKAILIYKEAGDNLELERKAGKDVTDKALEITSRLILECVCDENGNTILTEEDIPNIKLMPNRIINKITATAMKLSGVDIEAALEVAANLKNAGID